LCIAAGVVRAGFVTDLFGAPIRYGYRNGIALTIIVGQLPRLFGFSIDAAGIIDEAVAFADALRADLTNPVAPCRRHVAAEAGPCLIDAATEHRPSGTLRPSAAASPRRRSSERTKSGDELAIGWPPARRSTPGRSVASSRHPSSSRDRTPRS
jgi:hypothetical protein